MSKQFVLWSLALSVLSACASDTTGSNVAAVQEAIDNCQEELAKCDLMADDCEANAMDCMDAVSGDGASEGDVSSHCDGLYDMCLTKTEDTTFCEELRQACLDCATGHDDDDSDSDSDSDDECDSDSNDDGDTDGDDDSDADTDSDSDTDHCGHGGSGGSGGVILP